MAGEGLDERPVVLLGIEPAPGYDGRQRAASGPDVALVGCPDLGQRLGLVRASRIWVEDAEVDARRYHGEASVVLGIHRVPVGRMVVLLAPLGRAVGDYHRRAGHRGAFRLYPGAEVVPGIGLPRVVGVFGVLKQEIQLPGAQRMAGKGERNARSLLEQGRGEPAVGVVARPEIRPRGLFTV